MVRVRPIRTVRSPLTPGTLVTVPTARGATESHTYSTAGTYTVKLTVTDNGGATDTKSASVTVASPADAVLAADAFGRTATNSWGTADTGGSWTLAGGSSAFSVADGKGVIALSPSWNREVRLNSVSETSTVSTVDISTDEAPAGAATHFTMIGRQVGSSYYGARVRLEVGGVVRLYVLKNETALVSSYVLPNVSDEAGDLLHLKLEVSGTSPTTVRAKV